MSPELVTISYFMLFVLAVKVTAFTSLSFKHYRRSLGSRKRLGRYRPEVSIIVPSYNEELTLENCVNSLLKQDYKNIEIIIVDDGSTDATEKVGKRLSRSNSSVVKIYRKENGGKASALNYGIARSSGEIIVCMDADSIFLKNTVRMLVLNFYTKGLSAVCGNVKVANRDNLLSKHQAIEYITGFNMQRRGFAYLNCMQVISGAIGAFRKEHLETIGGYSSETIVEDMDATVALQKNGGRIEYCSSAIAYTEAPISLHNFYKQRYRWAIGGFQVLKKYRYMIFNPKYKRFGIVGLPYFMIFPWLDVMISLLFGLTVLSAVIENRIMEMMILYLVMVAVQTSLSLYSLYMDKEDKKLAMMVLIESFWYFHIVSFITVRAGVSYLLKTKPAWNKFERLGKNYLPRISN